MIPVSEVNKGILAVCLLISIPVCAAIAWIGIVNTPAIGVAGVDISNPYYQNTSGCFHCGAGSTGTFDVSYHDAGEIEEVECPRDKWTDDQGEYLSPNATCYEMPDGSVAFGTGDLQ